MFSTLFALVVSLIVLSTTSAAQNEDTRKRDKNFLIEALPLQLALRVADQDAMLAQVQLDTAAEPGDWDQRQKGVINAIKIWTPDIPVIRVCFVEGPNSVRIKIAEIASQWMLPGSSIKFDFGPKTAPRTCSTAERVLNHIRIGFRDDGYYSLIGKDSVTQASQAEVSMNFKDFDRSPQPVDDAEFREIVLHEFGHALGLEHEHQNSKGTCYEEFNWPQVRALLSSPPNKWSNKEIDFQMGRLMRRGLIADKFDAKSIMLYTFPAEYFTNGEQSSCFSLPNRIFSDGDTELVRRLYPADEVKRRGVIRDIRAGALQRLEQSGAAAGAKSAVLQIVNNYLTTN